MMAHGITQIHSWRLLSCLLILWSSKALSEDPRYLGCYVVRDTPSLGDTYSGVDNCLEHCNNTQNSFAATWKRFCLCAESIDGLEEDKDGCTIPCGDSDTQLCGGPKGRVSVYSIYPIPKEKVALPVYAWGLIGGGAFIIVVIIVIGVACARNKLKSWDHAAKNGSDHKSAMENDYSSIPSRRSYKYHDIPDKADLEGGTKLRDRNIIHRGDTDEESSTELETHASVYDLTESKERTQDHKDSAKKDKGSEKGAVDSEPTPELRLNNIFT